MSVIPLPANKPPPRPRNAEKTRARILEEAYFAFAEGGYARTGIREIAASAGIAPSLILRYFGSKAQLFEEAFVHGIHRDSVFVSGKAGFGRAMVELIESEADTRLTAMTVMALADPEAAEIATRVLERDAIGPLAKWLGGERADERAAELFALMTGFTVQFRLSAGRKMSDETMDWLARSLQDIVDNG